VQRGKNPAGAHHLKLMLGGVASPTDRVDSTQFTEDEIRAAVEEAAAANLYVLGHAYTSRAINRGLACGVSGC
jgi:imidazolonepropionase-like amidohydrolase